MLSQVPVGALDLILANFPPVILTHIMKDKNGGMNEEGDLRIFKNHSCEEAWANSVPYLLSEVRHRGENVPQVHNQLVPKATDDLFQSCPHQAP